MLVADLVKNRYIHIVVLTNDLALLRFLFIIFAYNVNVVVAL